MIFAPPGHDKDDRTVYSEHLLELRHECPDHRTSVVASATGMMYWQARFRCWVIEYVCPIDGMLFWVGTPETDRLAQHLSHEQGNN